MWRLGLMLLAVAVALSPANAREVPHPPADSDLMVLAYHDVVEVLQPGDDYVSVTLDSLVGHFSWLKSQGYTVVSVDALVAAREGRKPLPPKAVLLSFDDGYVSFYTRVYPLLREFHYPAVLALTGEWLDAPPDAKVYYDGELVARSAFLTPAQIRELVASGLVEIASHTYGLHRSILANPQGSLQAAAVTATYDPATGQYESEAAYLTRVGADLERNSSYLKELTGVRPRVIVWPYGRYTRQAMALAQEADMPIGFSLDDGAARIGAPLATTWRKLVVRNPNVPQFAEYMRDAEEPSPVRSVHQALSAFATSDQSVQDARLGAFLNDVEALAPSAVFVNPLTADGKAAYFVTSEFPLALDLLNRVCWQTETRAGAKAYVLWPPWGSPQALVDMARETSFSGIAFEGMDATRGRVLLAIAKQYRPMLQSLLRLSAQDDVLSTASAVRLALQSYDRVVLTFAAGSPSQRWVASLAQALGSREVRLKVVLELDATGQTNAAVATRMREFQSAGMLSFGLAAGTELPEFATGGALQRALSVRSFPLRR